MTMELFATCVPAVRHAEATAGEFVITPDTVLDTTALGPQNQVRIARLFRFLPFNLRPSGNANIIRFSMDAESLGPEAHRVVVTPERIDITAGSIDGCSLAVAVLRQLLPMDGYRRQPFSEVTWTVPAGVICDAPAVQWRGFLLDVARHFLPKRGVLRIIDLMADLRLNRLQLHLTDDQGWRIESDAFPELHRRGSHRRRTQISHFSGERVYDETPHGGYYTRADLREIVSYAKDRAIVVVPEIDLPGHTGALTAAYPELGVPAGALTEVIGDWGVNSALISPSPAAMEFLRVLFDEIVDVFDSPWIHVGGDESRLSVWERDADTMVLAKAAGVTDAQGLFATFMSDLDALLRAQGRTMITWDDAFASAPQADSKAVVMAWRGLDVARRAAQAGRHVVLSPVMPTYLDYYQAEDVREPMAIGGPVTLADVAAFDPLPADWSSEERERILGAQAQLWTEWIPTERNVDYALFPRLCAFAETVWTGAPVAADFSARLTHHLKRMDAYGVEYRPVDGPHPWQEGGTGTRAHRSSEPMAENLKRYEQAAAQGWIAFDEPASDARD